MKKHKIEAYVLIILAIVALFLTCFQGNLIYLFIFSVGVMIYGKHSTEEVSENDDNF